MKAIRAHQIGGPEVLRYEEIPNPIPGPGEALVDIQAIGVNFTDVSSRRGTNPPSSLPWTPGREAAGVVAAVGERVGEVAVGDRVPTKSGWSPALTPSPDRVGMVPSWMLVKLPPAPRCFTGPP